MNDYRQAVDLNMRLSNLERLVERITVPNKWLTIKEAAQYSSTSESTLRREVRKGSLKCSRHTGKLLFRRSAIDRWLDG